MMHIWQRKRAFDYEMSQINDLLLIIVMWLQFSTEGYMVIKQLNGMKYFVLFCILLSHILDKNAVSIVAIENA